MKGAGRFFECNTHRPARRVAQTETIRALRVVCYIFSVRPVTDAECTIDRLRVVRFIAIAKMCIG